jgi:hypothetical protein
MPSFGEKDKPGLFLGAEQSGMVEEAKKHQRGWHPSLRRQSKLPAEEL